MELILLIWMILYGLDMPMKASKEELKARMEELNK